MDNICFIPAPCRTRCRAAFRRVAGGVLPECGRGGEEINHGLHGLAALTLACFGMAWAAFAAEPTISVEARQRYPWYGLVDINFTITGDAGTKYDTSFTAKDMVGNTNVTMATIRKTDGAVAAAKESLLPGNYDWVWDAAADLPKNWQCDRVTVVGKTIGGFSYAVKFNANGGTGTMSNESFTYGTAKALTANAFTRTGYTFQGWATSASGTKVYNDKQSVSNLTETSGAVVNLYAVWKARLYMVIDLSAGSSASSYPVSYLDSVPSGGWGNTYKTTKLVLRRIEAGSFKMSGSYNVTLTKPFFIGVYEVTQKQYMLVTGANPVPSNASSIYGDALPVSEVDYKMIRGTTKGSRWPQSADVDDSSFLGQLQSRSGCKFDLPTEAQWEYACRATTTTKYNNGGNNESDLNLVGRYYGNSKENGTQKPSSPGKYKANLWGLYDMHGNVFELVLDWGGDLSGNVSDPKGPTTGKDRVKRGGAYTSYPDACASSYRKYSGGWTGISTDYGFRICLTLNE